MRNRKAITKELHDKINKLYDDGMSVPEIMKKFGLSKGVYNHIENKVRREHPKKEEAMKLFETYIPSEVQRRLCLGSATTHNWYKEYLDKLYDL